MSTIEACSSASRAEDECRVVEEVGEGGSKVGKRAGAAKGKDVVGVSVEAVAEKEVGGSADVRSGHEWVGLEAVGRKGGLLGGNGGGGDGGRLGRRRWCYRWRPTRTTSSGCGCGCPRPRWCGS